MASRKPTARKLEELRQRGCLNLKPDAVVRAWRGGGSAAAEARSASSSQAERGGGRVPSVDARRHPRTAGQGSGPHSSRALRSVCTSTELRAGIEAAGKKTALTCTATPARTDAGIVADNYEQLRSHVVVGRVSGVRHGLAILLQKGMAGWMEVCSSCRANAVPTTFRSSSGEDYLLDEHSSELVDLLANMALKQLMEETRI